MRRLALVAALAAFFPFAALAQNPGITPQGTYSAGDCYKVASNGNKFQAVSAGPCSSFVANALTRTNDTNVTITLSGTPATALLQAVGMTVGWSGTLSAARGGFGADVSAAAGVPLFAAGVPTFTATTGTGDFARATSPVFVTPNLGTPSAAVLTNATGLPLASILNAGGAQGDLICWNGTNWARLAANTSGLVLTANGAGACPTYQSAGAGTVTTITAGDGITLSSGATCTTTCTITNAGFSAGDMKPTYKTTADTGWVMMNDGTIGSATSGATTRANADTVNLYTVLWNNCSSPTANASCAVATGLGASAAADFAANKALALPKVLGRAVASAGAGSGLTSRTLGTTTGGESVTLAAGNLPSHTHATDGGSSTFGVSSAAGTQITITGGSNALTNLNTLNTGNCASCTATAFSVMQPSQFANWMIKL